MTIGKLLSSKCLLTSEITLIDYHLGGLKTDLEDCEEQFPRVTGTREGEKADFVLNLYKGKISNLLKKEEGKH